MKIAIIGSALHQAPAGAGIIHAPLKLSFDLAKALSERGHSVTFFGLFDPKVKTSFDKNNFGYKYNYQKFKDFRTDFFVAYEQSLIARVIEQSENFDVVYYHVPYRVGPFARMIKTPIVCTHHDSTHMNEYTPMYKSFANKNLFLIGISKHAKSLLDYPNYLGIAYNGIDPAEIDFVEKPSDYYCWAGRIVPSKGLQIAVKLAAEFGIKLKIAGTKRSYADFGDNSEYIRQINKFIKSNKTIEYLGNLSLSESRKLISNARGLIFPSDGTESCPMVVIEAMMAGTPVLTFNKGPMPELVLNGQTGYLCRNLTQMRWAIKKINNIDRKRCRQHAVDKFSLGKMAEKYEHFFNLAIKKTKQF